MTFTADTTVAEIATGVPASVKTFLRYGIDFCCGGKVALGAACRDRGVDYEEVARAIHASAVDPAGPERDWRNAEPGELADHIVSRFHDPLREDLPALQQLAARVLASHGDKDPDLARGISSALGELTAELLQHMAKEEAVLFPAIRRLDRGARAGIPIDMPIAVMEQEHEHAGALLARLRALTSGYQVPAWGCRTVRALYSGLERLEREMHLHVHLENNILFPRALEAAGLGRAGDAA